MEHAAPHRLFDRLALAIIVLTLATPITYLEVVHPNLQPLQSATAHLTPVMAPTKPPATTTKPAANPAPVASKIATTTTLVHLREAKSTSSTNITNIQPGTSVQLRDDSDITWQGVTYQGKTGYIYRDYLQY